MSVLSLKCNQCPYRQGEQGEGAKTISVLLNCVTYISENTSHERRAVYLKLGVPLTHGMSALPDRMSDYATVEMKEVAKAHAEVTVTNVIGALVIASTSKKTYELQLKLISFQRLNK